MAERVSSKPSTLGSLRNATKESEMSYREWDEP